MSETETWVAVSSTVESIEAEMIHGVLEAEGITAKIGEHFSAGVANRLTRAMHGTVYDVLVAESDADLARVLLDAYDQGDRRQFTDEELAAAADASYDPLV